MKCNYLWVIEMLWPKKSWTPTLSVRLCRDTLRKEKDKLETQYSGVKFRIRKYSSNEAT